MLKNIKTLVTSRIYETVFLVFAFILISILLFWFQTDGPIGKVESPIRVVLGGFFIFLLPGLTWAEVLGFRSHHFLKTIAISFSITIALGLIALATAVILGTGIWFWNASLLSLCTIGLFLLLKKFIDGYSFRFIKPFFLLFNGHNSLGISQIVIFFTLIFISVSTYHWGESLRDIGGEKLLHFTFIRYYFSLPLSLENLGLKKGSIPPNLIHLWEFLLAAWANLVHLDPLVVVFRARFVIPILGFSGMYLLVESIFPNRRKAELIFWIILLMCLGWIITLPPSSLDWIRGDPLRGVMSFMGTVHHSDSAQDILLPIMMALLIYAIRIFRLRWVVLCLAMITASFLWHPREFFQVAVYWGTLGISLLVFWKRDRKKLSLRWASLFGIFLAVAAGALLMTKLSEPQTSHAYNEMLIKKTVLEYSVHPESIVGIRNLFNFPLHNTITSSANPGYVAEMSEASMKMGEKWQYFPWLILSAFGAILLLLLGNGIEKRLAAYYVLLWFLVCSWNFSAYLIIALTYSEIFITVPRFIYLFSYIVIGSSFVVFFRLTKPKHGRKNILYYLHFISIFLISLMFTLMWKSQNGAVLRNLSYLLTGGCALALLWFLIKNKKSSWKENPKMRIVIAGSLLFFLPLLGGDWLDLGKKFLFHKRPTPNLFGKENPSGLSTELLSQFENLKKSTVLVPPLGKAVISIYSPIYLAVFPEKITSTIVAHRLEYERIRKGNHELFRETYPAHFLPDHLSVLRYLNQRRVEFLLINEEHYLPLKSYFYGNTRNYEAIYDDPSHRELLVKFLTLNELGE